MSDASIARTRVPNVLIHGPWSIRVMCAGAILAFIVAALSLTHVIRHDQISGTIVSMVERPPARGFFGEDVPRLTGVRAVHNMDLVPILRVQGGRYSGEYVTITDAPSAGVAVGVQATARMRAGGRAGWGASAGAQDYLAPVAAFVVMVALAAMAWTRSQDWYKTTRKEMRP